MLFWTFTFVSRSRASPEAALEPDVDAQLESWLKDWAKYWSVPMQSDAGEEITHENGGTSYQQQRKAES